MFRLTAGIVFAMLVICHSDADAGGLFKKGPNCDSKLCQTNEVVKKETRHCWEIECKEVCVPRIRFPWSRSCAPSCGRVRTVRTLKKREYECEKIGYEWKIVPICD